MYIFIYIDLVIDQTFPLDKVAEAFTYLAAGHAKGKVVVSIGPDSES